MALAPSQLFEKTLELQNTFALTLKLQRLSLTEGKKSIPASPTTFFEYHMTGVSRGKSLMQKKCRLTLPETNIAPENRPSQKETIVFQPSNFSCELLVSGREKNSKFSPH